MIYIFYHIYCNDKTESILQNQIQKIHFSGLYKTVDKIYCFIVGPDHFRNPCEELVKEAGAKFIIAETSSDDTTYERFTLLKIKHYIQSRDKFLYLHTKGVTRNRSIEEVKRVDQWRTYIEYHCMVHHELCLRALESYDAVGCNYRVGIFPVAKENGNIHTKGKHFSGNIFWCTAKYFLTLPSTIGDHYLDPELYVGINEPHIKCLYETWINHYSDDKGFYPFQKYVDNEKSDTIQFAYL